MLRFTTTERALHWGFALTYLLLLASGLPLMMPILRGWIRGYTTVVGVRLHLAGAVLWIVVPLMIVAIGDRRRLRETWRDLVSLRAEDRAWLRRFPRWLLSRSDRVRIDMTVGRFNGGQKLNATFTATSSALLLLTGLALWPLDAAGTVPCALLTGSESVRYWRAAHRWLTVIALGPLLGHVFLALLHPSTRHSLAGMLTGDVDRAWAATHHPRWRADAGDQSEGREARRP